MKDIDDIRRANMAILEVEAGSAEAAAARAGKAQSQWSNWKNAAPDSRTGKPRGMRKESARHIEKRFEKPVGWLDTDHSRDVELGDSSNVIALHPDDPIPEGRIQVPEYRVSFSAGNGHVASYDVIEEAAPATFRLDWFKKKGINPKNARRFKVTGDSMEPYLFAGDSILIDTADNDPNRIIDGKTYAIRYGDELRIKRLYRKLDGTIILRSYNPEYKDEEVSPELAQEHITILGRMRDRSGPGGE